MSLVLFGLKSGNGAFGIPFSSEIAYHLDEPVSKHKQKRF